MSAIGMLLLVIGLLVALVGPIRPSLFGRKGQAPKRRELFFMGVGAAAIGLVVVGMTAERPVGPNAEKVEAEPDKPARTQAAVAAPQAAPESAANAKPVTVRKPAIEVPAGAVAKYCTTETKKAAIVRESGRLFPPLSATAGLNAAQEQERKSEEWRAAQYAPLNNELEAALGLDLNKVLYLATEHQWDLKCRAIEAGRPFLDTAETLAATASDATSAKNALEGYYVFRLNSERYPLFDRNQYSAIRCSEEVIERSRFIGCQPISLSKRGLMGVFIVGRAGNGTVQIAPVNGTAMTHIADMPHLKAGEAEMPIAAYVGPSVDIPLAIKALE